MHNGPDSFEEDLVRKGGELLAELLVGDSSIFVLVQGVEQHGQVRLVQFQLQSTHFVLELLQVYGLV